MSNMTLSNGLQISVDIANVLLILSSVWAADMELLWAMGDMHQC